MGIELPATGEQANVWGDTVNRNMNTLDAAINGNVQVSIPSSPFQLTITNGAESPQGAYPLIIWTGPQSSQSEVQIDWQSSRQHLYIMSNQTSGGFPITFAQGAGSQFVLNAGYDAMIYTDGGGTSANVAQALANPQFNNLQVLGAFQTANLQMSGSLNGILSFDASGNTRLTGGLGVASPTAIPDPLTVNGLGLGGQIRLVTGNYGTILRNDGTSFYVLFTNAGDPYGAFTNARPLVMDLAGQSVTVDGQFSVNGAISLDGTLGLWTAVAGVSVNYLSTGSDGSFRIANYQGAPTLLLDTLGNVTVWGGLRCLAVGVTFPDGTTQATAYVAGGGGGGVFSNTANVTAQRLLGTTYTNSRATSLFATITLQMNGGSADDAVEFYLGTQLVAATQNNNNLLILSTTSIMVPPGETYRVTAQSGSSLISWQEWW